MALVDLVQTTKSILYGTGLGEKPTIVRVGEGAVVEGDTVNFTAEKVRAGHVVASYGATEADDAYVLYVVDQAIDGLLTAINGYLGSTPIEENTDLENNFIEVQPLVTEHEIIRAIDTIYSKMMWPEVYKMRTSIIAAPNLIDGQESVPADAEYIVSAWQELGPTIYSIPVTRQPRQVHTDLSATGRFAHFDWITATQGYVTYRTRYLLGDEDQHDIGYMVALGAAAVTLGGHVAEASLERAKKDNADGVDRRTAIGDRLWRDFLTLRQAHMEDVGKNLPQQLHINRG
jgi:hypothetical protein